MRSLQPDPHPAFPLPGGRRIVGLLGGSFNPAHAGHVHISRYALDKLHMDEVWWLVSPHNPLKDKNTLADYDERLRSAQEMANYRGIRVMDFERLHKLQYSYKTIRALKARNPHISFIWLMGADNLARFHRWQRWRDILAMLPIVVFDRAPYSYTAIASKTAGYAHAFFMKNSEIAARWPVPSLTFVRLKRNALSATFIRKSLGKRDYLGHNKIVKRL